MSDPILPPDPCLLAIILITRTRDGTSNVFHHPPHPGQDRKKQQHLTNSSTTGYDSDTSTSNSTSSADELSGTLTQPHLSDRDGLDSRANNGIDETGSGSPDKASQPSITDHGTWDRHGDGDGGTQRNGLLGLPSGFHHFLCPPDTFDRKRFEMSIDRLVFLGWPVYAGKDGVWGVRKVGRGKKKRRPSGTRTAKSEDPDPMARRQSVQLDRVVEAVGSEQESGGETTAAEDVSGFEAGYGHEEEEEEAGEKAPRKEVLSMFHVAFVLSPSPLEYQHRVDEMYNHVIKKFTKALRWEQVKSDFVLKESEKLKSFRSKGSFIDTALKHSPLARGIADLYTAISSSRIAQINLTERTSFSLQLPLRSSIDILPTLTEPQLPGMWLTTAQSSISSEDDIDTSGTGLASHFTLLPLQEPSSIIAELTAAQSPLTPYLANFLRHSTPNKSFLAISQTSNIPLTEIQHLASHLIYWRRARAIPPLHIRDIYITSPNADMRKLKVASSQYAKKFPALPSLPKILNRLSMSTPAPYSYILPSRDHKEAYLEILAWLMRGGWVTQLRTFAWVRVPVEIRARARQRMKEEEREKHVAKARKAIFHRRQESKTESEDSEEEASSHAGDDAGEPDLPSGYLTPMKSSVYSTATAESTSTTTTAIPVPSDLRDSEIRSGLEAPVLILDPKRASGMESRYLTAIAEQIEEELAADGKEVESKQVREIWEKCMKYFNGQHALEKIAVREGLKRKKVEALRERWKNRGYLLEVRHW